MPVAKGKLVLTFLIYLLDYSERKARVSLMVCFAVKQAGDRRIDILFGAKLSDYLCSSRHFRIHTIEIIPLNHANLPLRNNIR